jgi:transcriptional regulator with GAF, ATPase, and Fis domain
MMELVARVAPSDASVLLQGESGTGKELVANAIHQLSPRAKQPFVAVDCSGLPETLFESALFGHERGAFTGATTRTTGLVEAASGGTLFLDELGDIPLSIQVKLLRLLETGTYRRVGSPELRKAEVRTISATHRPLTDMVSQGLFRQDLFYRLNIFPIHLPPLRQRGDDVLLLAETLLDRVAGGRLRSRLSAEAAAWLRGYPIRAMCANCATFSNAPACSAMAMKYICSTCQWSWRRPGRCRHHPTVHRQRRATFRIAIRCPSRKWYATSKAAGKRSPVTLACQSGPSTVA